ncbi:MAG: ATP synthase F1 subunit delta [Planctomycetota bacterium]|nr:ATP synthase F1 subunit delta [Planctomycetota bacterium]
MPARVDAGAVARVYVKALLETGFERGALKEFERDLSALAEVVSAVPELRRFLSSPTAGAAAKKEVCLAAAGAAREEIRNLALLLLEKGRFGLIREIASRFSAALREMEGRVEATVVSARELPEDARKRLAGAIERRFGWKVDLRTEVDPGVVGGIVVKAAGRIFDDSLRSRLETIRRLMMEARPRAGVFADEPGDGTTGRSPA